MSVQDKQHANKLWKTNKLLPPPKLKAPKTSDTAGSFALGAEMGSKAVRLIALIRNLTGKTQNTTDSSRESLNPTVTTTNTKSPAASSAEDTAPKVSDIDTSCLKTGSKVTSVSQGNIDGVSGYVAEVTTSDGGTEQYAVTKDSSGKYTLGAKLSKTSGSNNYVNTDKLNNALKKEFGDNFELPQGYSAELVGDTLVIKDDNGKKLGAEEIDELKTSSQIIDAADINGDGILTAEELKTSLTEELESESNGKITDEMKTKINDSVEKLDTNQDGEISQTEILTNSDVFNNLLNSISGEDEVQTTENESEDNEAQEIDEDIVFTKEEWEKGGYEGVLGKFDELDTNHDGNLSEPELNPEN